MKFEKCICVPFESKGSNLFEWFINQDHIPFDMSSDAHGMYYTMYQDFLEEIEKKYTETGDNYYWFTKNGQLVSDEGREVILSNSVKVDKSKVREWKLSQILN
jgi:hypothetical protein